MTQAVKKKKGMEEPCEETGRPCDWIYNEITNEDGVLEDSETYCNNCFRWRTGSCGQTTGTLGEGRQPERRATH